MFSFIQARNPSACHVSPTQIQPQLTLLLPRLQHLCIEPQLDEDSCPHSSLSAPYHHVGSCQKAIVGDPILRSPFGHPSWSLDQRENFQPASTAKLRQLTPVWTRWFLHCMTANRPHPQKFVGHATDIRRGACFSSRDPKQGPFVQNPTVGPSPTRPSRYFWTVFFPQMGELAHWLRRDRHRREDRGGRV